MLWRNTQFAETVNLLRRHGVRRQNAVATALSCVRETCKQKMIFVRTKAVSRSACHRTP
jgi:hypothetical protein